MSFGGYQWVETPSVRTEYVSANDTHWRQSISSTLEIMREPVTTYQPDQQTERSWMKQPIRPTVVEGTENCSGSFCHWLPAYRTEDTLVLALAEWADAGRGHWGPLISAIDTTAFRIYRDGDLVHEAARAQGSFPMVPHQAEYRLELDAARSFPTWSTKTRTAWTIQSSQPPDGVEEIVPLMLVDYDVDLDLLNTAPLPQNRPGPYTVDLHVRHQRGSDGPAVGGARVWISYDDGDTWQPRPARRLGDGRYEAILDARDPADTSGYLSLRVEAWDIDGNRIEQEITRAWKLAPR